MNLNEIAHPAHTVRATPEVLAIVDRGPLDAAVLDKAKQTARRSGSALELFLCDAEHEYQLQRAFDTSGVAQARDFCITDGARYIGQLLSERPVEAAQVTAEVACETPLHEGLVHKVQQQGPWLVVKAPSHQAGSQSVLAGEDWELLRTCPVPLMFVNGRPWAENLRIVAAVDVSGNESPELARRLLDTASRLAEQAGGKLEVIYCEPVGSEAPTVAYRSDTLNALAREFHLPPDCVHIVAGQPEAELKKFVTAGNFDLLVVGALTHRVENAPHVGTLTRELIESVDCDFVVIKPEVYVCPIAVTS